MLSSPLPLLILLFYLGRGTVFLPSASGTSLRTCLGVASTTACWACALRRLLVGAAACSPPRFAPSSVACLSCTWLWHRVLPSLGAAFCVVRLRWS